MVKVLAMHQYSVDMFSYSGLSGILSLTESRIPLKMVLGSMIDIGKKCKTRSDAAKCGF